MRHPLALALPRTKAFDIYERYEDCEFLLDAVEGPQMRVEPGPAALCLPDSPLAGPEWALVWRLGLPAMFADLFAPRAPWPRPANVFVRVAEWGFVACAAMQAGDLVFYGSSEASDRYPAVAHVAYALDAAQLESRWPGLGVFRHVLGAVPARCGDRALVMRRAHDETPVRVRDFFT